MYLHTRLLLGILAITLLALAVSVAVPLASLRQDVSRETGASLQLAHLLFDIEAAARDSDSAQAARAAAVQEIRQAQHLRHVSLALEDPEGHVLASTPGGRPAQSWLSHLLLPKETGPAANYPVSYRGEPLGALRVQANPLSEFEELEDRVTSDMALLALAILAMAVSIYLMVRRGLRPVGQIKEALTRLAGGDLEARLPRFDLKDLGEIGEGFNHTAQVLNEAAQARRELTRRLNQVEEAERTRLSRELHDELGQSLTAIKVDAAYIAREAAGRAPQIEACARGIESLASGVMDLIRGMLARLRPHALETVGLRESLRELIAGWEARLSGRFQCSLVMGEAVDGLPPELNVALFRLVQECMTNAVRHSQARALAIRLTAEPAAGGRVRLRVQESGGEAQPAPAGEGGMGVLGMRERVESLGGQLHLSPTPGGLTLEAWLPLPGPEAGGG